MSHKPAAPPPAPQPPRPVLSHVVGLDLGKQQDASALCVLEVREFPGGEPPASYEAVALKRWHLGTPYPDVVRDTLRLLDDPRLRFPLLVVDETGVGAGVVDFFREASAPMLGVSIGAGEAAPSRRPDGTWRVSKKDLVSAPLALLSARRLTFARGLAFLDAMKKDLAAFQVKITRSANETFGAAGGAHDDLVLALALACWAAERACGASCEQTPHEDNCTEVSKAPEGVFLT